MAWRGSGLPLDDLPLFGEPRDPAEEAIVRGQEARERALRLAAGAADPSWWDAALEAVRSVAAVQATLTADDVWGELERSWSQVGTAEPRALGAVMTVAARAGMIETTEEHRPSRRPEAHARPMRVWRSLL